MSNFAVQTGELPGIVKQYSRIGSSLEDDIQKLEKQIDRLDGQYGFGVEGIQGRLENIKAGLYREKEQTASLSVFLTFLESETSTVDSKSGQLLDRETVLAEQEQSFLDKFIENFRNQFGWSELLKGSNYIGKIYNFIKNGKDGLSWKELSDIYEFLSGAATTFKNYMRIGNAVGKKTALTWWAKNITGWKPLGRASTAKNPFQRFKNNLTNKTSPFNAQFKEIIDNFKGSNGAGKAIAAWGAVAISGICNWFSNKEEQAASNGEMSDARVIAETVTETAIDTALTYGAGIVVGAAVTTIMGTAAAPAVVVTALSGLLIAGTNALVNAATGKTVTEWASDLILDSAEKVGDWVGEGVNKVKNAVASWFKKPAYA